MDANALSGDAESADLVDLSKVDSSDTVLECPVPSKLFMSLCIA